MKLTVLRSFRYLAAPKHVLSRNITRVLSPTTHFPMTRWHSSIPDAYQYLTVKPDVQKGVSVLEMKKKPVNGLSLEFLTELNIALEKIASDRSVRGVIISSALPVFSAGLDIMELYQPKEERLRIFWLNVQELTLNLFTLPKIVITAIDGSCIAGGCIFPWSSDYRIMSEGKHRIGLNETQLGIAAPFWLAELAERAMGLRNAEKMLQLGETYPPSEALQLGAVDETCPQGKALEIALERMPKWMAIQDLGRLFSKQMVRQSFVDKLRQRREEDIDSFCNLVSLDGTQRLLEQYLEAMKKKSK